MADVEASEWCGDLSIDSLGTTFTCDLDPSHEGLHHGQRVPGISHYWSDEHCRAITTAESRTFSCILAPDHGPYHAAVSGPGKRFNWIDAAPCGPECAEGHTYRLGDCEEAVAQLVPPVFVTGTRRGYTTARGLYHVTVTTDAGPLRFNVDTYDYIDDATFEAFMSAWLAGDEARCRVLLGEPDPRDGLKHLAEANDREKARITAEDARMDRDRAIEHAIHALPALGPHGFKPGAGDEGLSSIEWFAAGIIALAKQLDDYIQNGT